VLLQAVDEFFSKLESQKLDIKVLQQVGGLFTLISLKIDL
jgi:hypothetical protein